MQFGDAVTARLTVLARQPRVGEAPKWRSLFGQKFLVSRMPNCLGAPGYLRFRPLVIASI
jgi:hypothetical protein